MSAYGAFSIRQDRGRTIDAEWHEVVTRMPLFASLGKRELRKLMREAEFAVFVPGDIVLGEDSPADFFYAVVDGEAEVRGVATPPRLGRGDYFGEAALLDGASSSATVVATNELTVMRLPGAVFLRLVERSPRAALTILRRLGSRARSDARPLPDAA